MDREDRRSREAVIRTWQRLEARGLDGAGVADVSLRHGAGLLITPATPAPGQAAANDVVQLDWEGCFAAGRRPSTAWRLHRDLLAARPDIAAVIRCESPFATALACHGRSIPAFHERVLSAGGTTIACASHAAGGTPELSSHTLAALDGTRACLVAQHGLVALGVTLDDTFTTALRVEGLAQTYLLALGLGEPPLLSAEELDAARERLLRMAEGMDPEP